MLGFPKKTEYNRVIPKNKFYEKAEVSPTLKAAFIDDVEKIIWTNKLSPSTLNIGAGSDIEEIEVFHILLKNKNFNQKILDAIDKAIPYYILFVLEYNGKQQVWLGYKEKNTSSRGNNKATIIKYFKSEWEKDISLPIKGNKLDSVYENFLSELSSDLSNSNPSIPLEEKIQQIEEQDDIAKKIKQLTTKLHREKQFNRQIEINKEIKALNKQLDELKKNNEYPNKELTFELVHSKQYSDIRCNPGAAYTCLLKLKGYEQEEIRNRYKEYFKDEWHRHRGAENRKIRFGIELYKFYGQEIKQQISHIQNDVEKFDYICNFIKENNITQNGLLNYSSSIIESFPNTADDALNKITHYMEVFDISIDELAKYIQEKNNG